jgi:hypothetical protein
MAVPNVLDFALAHFGPAAAPELYDAIRDASAPALDDFLTSYRVFAANPDHRPPRLSSEELRPYLPHAQSPTWTGGGLELDYDTLKHDDAEWRLADAVKHRLLYCHSIALDDPLEHLLTLATGEMRTCQGSEGRQALLRYVSFLLHMAPVVREGVVCLVGGAFSGADWMARHGRRVEFAAALSQGGGYDAREFMEAAPPEVRALWKRKQSTPGYINLGTEAALSVATERIAIGLDSVLEAPDRLSLYLPFRADVQLLVRDTQLSKALKAAQFSDRDSWLLEQLIDIEMPGISALEPSELVRVRSGSEFAEWRTTLTNALQTANALPSTLYLRDLEVQRAVRALLTEGRSKLEERLARSRTLAGVKRTRTSLIVGLMGLGVSALLDPTKLTTAAIAALIASSTTAGALEALQAGRPSAAANAQLAHYVAALT